MKALVLKRDKVLDFTDVPDPTRPGPDWALIRIAFSGICNSDLHRGFEGGAYHYPLIMGHEFSGIVEEPGASGRFPAGVRVAVFPLIPCRRCAPCQTGDFAQCIDYDYLGSRRDGAFAERVWAPEANLFEVPRGVELRDAGVNKLSLRPGETGAVFGAGPIGNMAAQWMRLRGCAEVLIVDIDARKLEIARAMGFTPVNARDRDPVRTILERTGGNGAEAIVEAIGLPLTFLQALQTAARAGEVLFMGNIRGEFSIGEKDFSSILRREIAIKGTWNSRIVPEAKNDWTTALASMGKRIDVASLISHTPALAEGPEIFSRIRGGKEFFNKVVFAP
jgi:L-iditol 2-dehydrogenase/galactitol-1-phosphate 5-dehydrogenase